MTRWIWNQPGNLSLLFLIYQIIFQQASRSSHNKLYNQKNQSGIWSISTLIDFGFGRSQMDL